MRHAKLSRREFLTDVAAVALPVAAVGLPRSARAQGLPRLDSADPTAVALHYVNDANQVDRANPQTARYAPGQTCATCMHIQGAEGDQWRPCALFPGKAVNADGWCMVWAPKA